MRTLCQILTVIFVLAIIGSLTQGKIFLGGIILSCICGYFGFIKEDSKPQAEKEKITSIGKKVTAIPINNSINEVNSNIPSKIISKPNYQELFADIPNYLVSVNSVIVSPYLNNPCESTAFNLLKFFVNSDQEKLGNWVNSTIEKCIIKFTEEYPTQLGFYFLAMSYYTAKSNFAKCFHYLDRVENLLKNCPILFGSEELQNLVHFKMLREAKNSEMTSSITTTNINELQALHNQFPSSSDVAFKLLCEMVDIELSKNSNEPNYKLDKLIDEFLNKRFPKDIEMHFLGIQYYLKKNNLYAAEKITYILNEKSHEGQVNLNYKQNLTLAQVLDEIKK